MTPLFFTLLIALISVSAGLLGSLVGVGGGIIVVPALTLLMGVDIRSAIAASIIAVIATSSGAASGYVRQRLTNLRLAMLLETATAAGALCGAFLAALVSGHWLYLLFGLVLIYTAWSMSRTPSQAAHTLPADPWADRLELHTSYFDKALGREIAYRVSRTKLGLAVSYVAGVLSGLLGIGGGVLKVPVMNLAMGIPLKVCTATSNFMIGVTAATGAAVYFARGDVQPFIAAPVAVGLLLGAKAGSRLLGRLHSRWIRLAFVVVLLVSSVQMLAKAFR
ncbi:MAG: sulfite exporter TauE/SafE family protein [Chthoniobacteraceae bacterium]|nr:sulfite exporter TauE/SafE family protein [Chthoniobacteraceae bacterium]